MHTGLSTFKQLLFTLFILLFTQLYSKVENPVAPSMAYFQNSRNIEWKKFSDKQQNFIKEVLKEDKIRIRFMSYNMLHSAYSHKLDKKYSFENRLPLMVELIKLVNPDILACQELFINEINELKKHLKEYDFYGKGDADGAVYGEINGMFFKRDRFKLKEKMRYFFTDTPLVLDNSSSALKKVLNITLLEDQKSMQSFYAMNTHFSFKNPNVREYCVEKINQWLEEEFNHYPVVLMGDLNTFPCLMDRINLPFYDGDFLLTQLTKGRLSLASKVSALGSIGPISTYTNKEGRSFAPFQSTGTPGVILDHILLTKDFQVIMHAVESATVNGMFPSDHQPVVVDAYLR